VEFSRVENKGGEHDWDIHIHISLGLHMDIPSEV
jgi:hypothetical protein